MAVYTYWFYDLVSNQPIAVLPMKTVNFNSILNSPGTFQSVLELADPNVQKANPIAATQPGRTAIYADRDGTLVWGGILWTRRYQSMDSTLQLGGQDFLSYLNYRYLAVPKTYTAQDPLTIASDLLAASKTAKGGDIGIQISAPSSSGQQVTQTWNLWDLKSIGEAIRDLSKTYFGYDIGLDVAWSGGVPTKTLTLSYPRRGRPANATGLVWEYPGNVVSYSWPEDATQMGTTVYEVGSGSGNTMLMVSASTPSQIDGGYPVLEQVISYKDVTDRNRLAAHAQGDARVRANPIALPTAHVRAERDPVLGSYITGDDARLRFTDARFPQPAAGGAGIDTYMRVTMIDVTPQDDGSERVNLTYGPPPQ